MGMLTPNSERESEFEPQRGQSLIYLVSSLTDGFKLKQKVTFTTMWRDRGQTQGA